jgi:hypothetical protein
MDVRGFLAAGDTASFTLVTSDVHPAEGTLTATYAGGSVDVRSLRAVDQISFCDAGDDACVEFAGANHLRISAIGPLDLGALTLDAPDLRVRWDLVLDP